MRTIHEIRLKNLRKLAEAYPTQAAFADAIGKVPTQVSRFMGKNPTKIVGEELASEIEQSLGLDEGSLDIPMYEVGARKYQDSLYLNADDEMKEIVDSFADEMLSMPKEEAERLKKAMELLRGSNPRKD